MIRFHMPDGALPMREKTNQLEEQFTCFERSEALKELFSVLGTDRGRLPLEYGRRRKSSGAVMETQEMEPMQELEEHRFRLYSLFQELGFIDINMPLKPRHSRVLILGGALGACFDRTRCAAQFTAADTVSVDALTCFRPINPVERKRKDVGSAADTEFGALTEALNACYELEPSRWADEFTGDRNLNSIACVRAYDEAGPAGGTLETSGCAYRLFAAPSSDPGKRRADTGDCLCYYLEKTRPEQRDSILAVTSNRYCNRQFVQMAWELIRADCPADFDIIGCRRGTSIDRVETYDPLQYLQDLIGILDWIDRFRRLVNCPGEGSE